MIDADKLVYDHAAGRVLDEVSFVLRPGAVLALAGPTGAGKSTLLRCLAALDMPTRGTVTVLGLDTRRKPREVHAAIGFLPDIYGLYDRLSVRQSLIHAARARGVGVEHAEAAAEAAAARVALFDRMETAVGALSRDLRRRLALAQAIAHRPRVLLLDEPAAGLDPDARQALSALIRGLAEEGATLVISGELSELTPDCTDILVLEAGRVIGDGVAKIDSEAGRTLLWTYGPDGPAMAVPATAVPATAAPATAVPATVVRTAGA